jgi:hypothetical protein
MLEKQGVLRWVILTAKGKSGRLCCHGVHARVAENLNCGLKRIS